MEKEKNKLNFLIGFLYGIYILSILNEIFMVRISNFIINVNDFIFNFGFILIVLTWIQNQNIIEIKKLLLKKIFKDEYIIFFNTIVISHIIFFCGFFEYILNIFNNINEDLLIYILSIFFFMVSLTLLIKATKKRLLILTVVIFFLQVLYQTIFFISFKNQMALYEESYYSLAKNDIIAKECGSFFNCTRLDKSNVENDLLKTTETINDKKVKTILETAIIGLVEKIKNDKSDIIVFSYGDNFKYFKSKSYMPIYVYNKNTGLLITDYRSNINLLKYHTVLRKKLTGTSYLIWFLFSFLIIILHRSIKYNHEKQ